LGVGFEKLRGCAVESWPLEISVTEGLRV